MHRTALALLAAAALTGCARPPPPSPREASRAPATAASPVTPSPRSAGPARPASLPSAPSSTTPAPPAAAAFPPPPISPPFARSAGDRDGTWSPLGEADRGDRLAGEPRLMYRTVLHPHPVSRFKSLTVVAIDLTQADLHYVPGRSDVDDVKANLDAENVMPGRVSPEHLDQLLVVFNGGFKPRHGRWGMRVAGRTLVAPRDEGCTIALFDPASIAIRSWTALSERADQIDSFRQTPPCLVERGKRHPLLEARNERPWGGHDPKRITRRRSALGIDSSQRILYYAVGVELEPSELAQGLIYAGAQSAAELDINWSWTRFLLIGRPDPDAPLQVTATLIPEMVHQRLGYVHEAIDRDFFYVTRRRSAGRPAPAPPPTDEAG